MSDDTLRPNTNRFTSIEKWWLWMFSVIALVSRAALAFRTDARIATVPYGDDAFYVFSIARNLALGRGPSVDGIHPTNGFQPLIAYLYAPIFWLCSPNDWLAIRWTFVLSGVIAAISVWLIAMLVRTLLRTYRPMPFRLTAPVIGAFLWACSIALIKEATVGLETELYLMLLIAVTIVWAKKLRITNYSSKFVRNSWPFGVLLGLTVLTRIDAAILVVIFAAFLVQKKQWRAAIVVAGVALLVSLPWWIFNLTQFGSLMPMSGQSENSWPIASFDNVTHLIEAFTDAALLLIYIPVTMTPFGRISVAVGTGLLWYGIMRRTKLLEQLRSQTDLFFLLPFGIFTLALAVYYTIFMRAPHFIVRYLQPMRVMWVAFAAVSAPILWETYQSFSSRRRKLSLLLISVIIVCSLGIYANRYLYYYTITEKPEFYNMGLWAVRHPTEKIGLLQSGIAGFIASHAMDVPNVVNLDGKVNAEALRAHQQGRLAEYIRNEHLTYIADQKAMIEDIDTMCRKDNIYFDSVGLIGDPRLMNDIQLMKRR
jgi:hypothetical protein